MAQQQQQQQFATFASLLPRSGERWWPTVAVALLSVAAAVLLAAVVVLAANARAKLDRLGMSAVSGQTGGSDGSRSRNGSSSGRSSVRTYAITIDLDASRAASAFANAGNAPLTATDAALFDCGTGGPESLGGTYAAAAVVALRPASGDAERLYEDLANGRARFLMLSGSLARAWVWRDRPRDIPGVPDDGTVVVMLAPADGIRLDRSSVPSTSACSGSNGSGFSRPWPVDVPIDVDTPLSQVAASYASGSGAMPLVAWGF